MSLGEERPRHYSHNCFLLLSQLYRLCGTAPTCPLINYTDKHVEGRIVYYTKASWARVVHFARRVLVRMLENACIA